MRGTGRPFRIVSLTAGLIATVLAAVPAVAAEIGGGKGPSESIFAAQIVVLLVVGRLFGEIMQRIRQPAVIGQLLAGIVLGPSVFGALWPSAHHLIFPGDPAQKAMIAGVGQLGVLLLLMLTGMETDIGLVKRVGRAAVGVSLSGIAIPFACGVLLGEWLLPESMLPAADKRLVTALFLGTALSISSIKIVAMVIREMNFMRRDLGQIIVSSAIIDDTIGWIIVALIFGVARPGGLDWHALAITVGSTALFLVVSYTVGRRIVAALIRWANDRLVSELPVITMALCIMGAMAVLTDVIGVNTVLGAFVAGVLIGQSPLLTRHIEEQLRGLIVALFAPVFFALAGLSTDITILKDPVLLGLTALLVLIASAGKFGGAFLGGAIGGLKRRESLALALGMNARGSTEVIVASIGLSVGALTKDLFSMIVAMAVFTTMLMPPTLRWALARLPLNESEAKRLAREAYDEHGFVAGLERLLLDVDGSPSGRLASRLVGLLGGPRGLPITVLQADAVEGARADTGAIAAVTAGAEAAAPNDHDAEATPAPDVSVETVALSRREAIEIEGRKGYDLLAIGLEETCGRAIPRAIAEAIAVFPGSRLVVSAKADLAEVKPRFLVPVKGTEASRRAAELACALAQSARSEVHVLYVVDPAGQGANARDARPARRLGRDILVDLGRIAERYDVPMHKHLRVSDHPAEAILRQAVRNRATIILLGADERPTDTLTFGATADALLRQSEIAVAILSAPTRSPEPASQRQGAPDEGPAEPAADGTRQDAAVDVGAR